MIITLWYSTVRYGQYAVLRKKSTVRYGHLGSTATPQFLLHTESKFAQVSILSSSIFHFVRQIVLIILKNYTSNQVNLSTHFTRKLFVRRCFAQFFFLQLRFGFVFYWRKKTARKMLRKLTPECPKNSKKSHTKLCLK